MHLYRLEALITRYSPADSALARLPASVRYTGPLYLRPSYDTKKAADVSRVLHLLGNSAASKPCLEGVSPRGLSAELKRPGIAS